MKIVKRHLALLLALGLATAILLPPFQGPDESVHFGRTLRWEGVFTGKSPEQCIEKVERALLEFRTPGVRNNPLGSYAAPLQEPNRRYALNYDHGCERVERWNSLYYIMGGLLLAGLPDNILVEFYALRFLSWIFYALAAVAMLKIGYRFFKNTGDAFGVAALIAMNPVWSVANTSINPDSIENMLFVVAVGMALLFLEGKGGKKWWSVAAGLAVLAVWAKTTGVILPLFLGIAVVMGQKEVRWKRVLPGAAVFFALAWWVVSENVGIEQGLGKIISMGRVEFFQTFVVAREWMAWKSFWGGGGFGWLDTYAPSAWIALFSIMTLIAGAGIVRRFKQRNGVHSKTILYFVATAVLFEISAMAYSLPQWNPRFFETSFAQGRYYLPLAFPFYILLTFGLKSLASDAAWERWGRTLLVTVAAVYSLTLWAGVIVPRYYF